MRMTASFVAIVAALPILSPAANAYTCADFLAARNIDARGPPFSAPMDDAVRYVVSVHPSVAADDRKLGAVGYLTGVYCGEPGHRHAQLHAVIDGMLWTRSGTTSSPRAPLDGTGT